MKKISKLNKKTRRKYLTVLGCLILILGIFVTCKVKNVSFSYLLNNTIESFFSPRQVVEEKADIPLENIVSKMYVTMLDEDMSVVATTNPDTVVNEVYEFKDENGPKQLLEVDDELFILFEIAKTIDPSLENGIEEDVFYYLDLPEYIIPSSEIIVGEGLDEPIKFKNGGKVNAVGGIYKIDNTYKFRIKFQNLEDQQNITANYQFSIKLDEKILENNSNLQHVSFGIPGILNFWIKIPKIEEPVVEAVTNYDLKVNVGWGENKLTSASVDSLELYWNVVVSEKENDMLTDKTLNFALGTGSGFVANYSDLTNYGDDLYKITIYYNDDTEKVLTSKYLGNYEFAFYDQDVGEDKILLNIKPTNFYTKSSMGLDYYFARTIQVDFKEENIKDVKNIIKWDIGIVSEIYHNAYEQYRISSASYYGTATLNDAYSDGSSLVKSNYKYRSYSSPGVSFGQVKSTETYIANFPKYIDNTVEFNGKNVNGANIISFEYSPSSSNGLSVGYYVDKGAFLMGDTQSLTATFSEFKVGENTEWESLGAYSKNLIVEKTEDIIFQKQVSDMNFSSTVALYKSKNVNENGNIIM